MPQGVVQAYVVGVAPEVGGRTVEVPSNIGYNSQASVIVYADDNPITSAIGWLWIRLVSVFIHVT
jgi:hypothetical protein